jgi:hypothetical protein
MQASFDAPATPPRNYFVPHFGEDEDVMATKKNEKLAAAQLHHVWVPKDPPTPPPMDYFVPNFGVDHDIITTQNNFKNAGGKLAQK